MDKRHNKGKKHWNYKTGLPYCLDCGKQLNDYRAKRCQSCFGKWERGKNHPNYKDGKSCHKSKKYFCKCGKEIWCTSKQCKSCSKKGKLNHQYGKPFIPKKYKYCNKWFRSSWEVAYAKYLDKNNIKWLYEPKTFDLGNTTYTPDFYLPETDTYIEIKGRWIRDSKRKINMTCKKYKIKLNIFFKKDLIKLNIKGIK